jgi:hypothetical protein
MLRFHNSLHVDKGYIYRRNTRINVTRKIILTGEAQHGAGDKPNQVAESVVARLRPRRSESQFSIPAQSGEISHRNCPDRPWELPNLLHIAKGKFFPGLANWQRRVTNQVNFIYC